MIRLDRTEYDGKPFSDALIGSMDHDQLSLSIFAEGYTLIMVLYRTGGIPGAPR